MTGERWTVDATGNDEDGAIEYAVRVSDGSETGDTDAPRIATAYEHDNAHLIAAAPELAEALRGLFEHCAMVHKVWGEGSNQREADAAIEAARAALAKVAP